jgi:hypothetical protein
MTGCPADLWTEREDGTWTNDPAEVARTIDGLDAAAPNSVVPGGGATAPSLPLLRGGVAEARSALARALAAAEVASEIDSLVADRRATTGLRGVERQGAVLARARRWSEVAAADRALRFLRRGHRAGEAAIARAMVANEPTARATGAALGDPPRSVPRLVALVLVDPTAASG